MREQVVRVAAILLGVLMLLGAVGFLVAVLTDSLPGWRLVTSLGMLALGWTFLSHGIGWQTPFRRRGVEVAQPPEK